MAIKSSHFLTALFGPLHIGTLTHHWPLVEALFSRKFFYMHSFYTFYFMVMPVADSGCCINAGDSILGLVFR